MYTKISAQATPRDSLEHLGSRNDHECRFRRKQERFCSLCGRLVHILVSGLRLKFSDPVRLPIASLSKRPGCSLSSKLLLDDPSLSTAAAWSLGFFFAPKCL